MQHTHSLIPDSLFGRSISQIYADLKKIQHEIFPENFNSALWRQHSFPVIRKFFFAKDLSEMTFTIQDQMFMMSDPLADQIRRVFAHQWLAQKLLKSAELSKDNLTENDLAIIRKVAHVMLCSGYSRFLGIDEEDSKPESSDWKEVWLTDRIINDAVESAKSLSPSGNGFIRLFAHNIETECDKLCTEVSEVWDETYTSKSARLLIDPGHLWMNLVFDLRAFFIWKADENFVGNHHDFDQPISFMILEDNPLHQWSFSPLKKIHGASFYLPQKQSRLFTGNMSDYCYAYAEEAKAEIESAIHNGFNLPDVIISDIELKDRNKNGLDFIRWLDQVLKAADRRSEVSLVMVYSSNMTFYDEQVLELQNAGIINSFCNKRNFTLKAILDQVATPQFQREKT